MTTDGIILKNIGNVRSYKNLLYIYFSKHINNFFELIPIIDLLDLLDFIELLNMILKKFHWSTQFTSRKDVLENHREHKGLVLKWIDGTKLAH